MSELPQPWNITHEPTCEEANCGCLVRALQSRIAHALTIVRSPQHRAHIHRCQDCHLAHEIETALTRNPDE